MGKVPELSECVIDFYPVEYNVVVCPEVVGDKTAGGLWLPEDVKENQDLAQTWGLLVAKSPLAFNYDNWPEDADQPKPGDHVFYARYAGTVIKSGGKEYRIMKDKDIALVRRQESAQ